MEKVSQHKTVRTMYEKTKADGMSSVFDRFDAQEKTRCSFCQQGLSCQLCSMGPCRITKFADRGVCGIDANAMVMRNFVHVNVFGASAYTYHAKEAVKTLRAAAQGKTPFGIKNEPKVMELAGAFGVDTAGSAGEVAVRLADFFWAELHKDTDEKNNIIEYFVPEGRIKIWKNLGILPGGPLHEILETETRCMTNIDSDYVSLALKSLRMGIATASAQVVLEASQDALFRTPTIHETEVDMGIIDKDYVNILPNGHEPFVGAAVIELAHRPEYQKLATDAGAKGLRVIGSIETGQELIQRYPTDDVFVGLTGNFLNQEFVLATGAVDLFAADMNCVAPTVAEYAKKYNSTIASVSKLVSLPGVDNKFEYTPETVEEIAKALIDLAVENFRNRQGKETFIPQRKQKAMVGFSAEAIVGALGGSLDPLLDVIKSGAIKGVTALVSCTTMTDGPQDALTVSVAKELIKRDILVLGAGCGNAAMQVDGLQVPEAAKLAGDGLRGVCESLGIPPVLSFGTCTDTGRIASLVTVIANALGVDTAELPVAVSAPEYMEQKATIDAVFAVAFGLYTHVAPTPPVTGAPDVVKLLTEDIEGLTGGKIAVGTDPVAIADGIEAHIMKKRVALGIA